MNLTIEALKTLTRHRLHLVKETSKHKQHTSRLITIVFPETATAFCTTSLAAVRELLIQFPSAKSIARADIRKLTFGIEKTVFDRMLKILNIARTYNKESNMGRPTKLEALDCLIITLMYWREYRTFRHIAYDYGISKSSVGRAVHWAEDTLISSGVFNLKSKRELHENLSKIEIIVIDVTEQEIERPKKCQKDWYSGKKRKHNQDINYS